MEVKTVLTLSLTACEQFIGMDVIAENLLVVGRFINIIILSALWKSSSHATSCISDFQPFFKMILFIYCVKI